MRFARWELENALNGMADPAAGRRDSRSCRAQNGDAACLAKESELTIFGPFEHRNRAASHYPNVSATTPPRFY